MLNIEEICKTAKSASHKLALASTKEKNAILKHLAIWLNENKKEIVSQNNLDIADGKKMGLSAHLIDRLTLTTERVEGMARDVQNVIALPDPVGEVFEEKKLINGLKVRKQRIPLGVLAVIYESRPNVTIDVASLALKSGNAIILRGGKETIRTNTILVRGIHETLIRHNTSNDVVQFISDPDRTHVQNLLRMYDYVDMLIPRGGAGLHKYCRENSMIPVITGGIGICHLFIDESANLKRCLPLIHNAKMQRPTTCNSLDTILVHTAIAQTFIPTLVEYLAKDGVAFRLGERALSYLNNVSSYNIKPAGPDDFDTEWLSLVLGIKVVDGLDDALAHIRTHSTSHSDGILTADEQNAARFVAEVDSAAVYVNTSTRFTDGAQFGLGAEVAVSTQRLHARGPMALRELTTYKWVVEGNYSIRK